MLACSRSGRPRSTCALRSLPGHWRRDCSAPLSAFAQCRIASNKNNWNKIGKLIIKYRGRSCLYEAEAGFIALAHQGAEMTRMHLYLPLQYPKPYAGLHHLVRLHQCRLDWNLTLLARMPLKINIAFNVKTDRGAADKDLPIALLEDLHTSGRQTKLAWAPLCSWSAQSALHCPSRPCTEPNEPEPGQSPLETTRKMVRTALGSINQLFWNP